MPPKDAGKGAKGKGAPPPPAANSGKISGPKLRTPQLDALYNGGAEAVSAKELPVYNPIVHTAPICYGGFSEFPGRRAHCRPTLAVGLGTDPYASKRPAAGSGGAPGGGAAKGKDAKGAKGKDAPKKKK